ncbi:MAG: ABC transporter permease [Flavobacteriales bacterium]|nr:ABC transporter permease [Flavobacteriales bacterium]
MRQFLAFVKKEFRHIFRDRRTLLILFGMPVAQVMIFGFALNNEVENAGVAIFDMSMDYESTLLINHIDVSSYFFVDRTCRNIECIEDAFRTNTARLGIVIPADFGSKLWRGENPAIKIIGDASDPNQAQVLTTYAKAIIQSHLAERASVTIELPILRSTSRMVFNPELKAVYMFVPGIMGFILLLVSAMMTSLTIAREKELGTMELLLVSPLRSAHIIFGKVAPYWLLSFVNAIIIVLLGIVVFDTPMNGSVVLLTMSCLLFSLTALALGIFISARSSSQMTAMLISMMGLLLPTILLSGFIFPIENMPVVLQVVSNVIPAKWFIILIKGLMIKGSGINMLWKPFAILLFITVLLSIAAIRNVKPRLES